jgi:hypothetical protein
MQTGLEMVSKLHLSPNGRVAPQMGHTSYFFDWVQHKPPINAHILAHHVCWETRLSRSTCALMRRLIF